LFTLLLPLDSLSKDCFTNFTIRNIYSYQSISIDAEYELAPDTVQHGSAWRNLHRRPWGSFLLGRCGGHGGRNRYRSRCFLFDPIMTGQSKALRKLKAPNPFYTGTCPECGTANVRWSRRRGPLERWVFRLLRIKPLRCLECGKRFYSVRPPQY